VREEIPGTGFTRVEEALVPGRWEHGARVRAGMGSRPACVLLGLRDYGAGVASLIVPSEGNTRKPSAVAGSGPSLRISPAV
jgi:hypothetical protein